MSTTDKQIPCPLCAKLFKTNAVVRNHMNQRTFYCRYYYESVMHFNTPSTSNSNISVPNLPSIQGGNSEDQDSFASVDEGYARENTETLPGFNRDYDMDMDKEIVDSQTDQQPSQYGPFYVQHYPGAAKIFGNGKTFMDIFYEDIHASKWEKNEYYPFASADEWELASYLLKSGLSISAINEFLKVKLVSHIDQKLSVLKHLYRYKGSSSPFELRRICVIVRKYFRLVQDGTPYLWKPLFLRQTRLISSTEIH